MEFTTTNDPGLFMLGGTDTESRGKMPDSDGWKDVSEPSLSKGREVRATFDRHRVEWEEKCTAFLDEGETQYFELSTPKNHLVHKVFQYLNQYVKWFKGWSLKRREATPQEREDYRITSKKKVYFILAGYTVPVEISEQDTGHAAEPLSVDVPATTDNDDNNNTGYDGQYASMEASHFAKSSNSAFQPARLRLHDSTNAAVNEGEETKFTKTVHLNESAETHEDSTRSFIPVVGSPERQPSSFSSVKYPKSPYELPERSLFSGISDAVLQAAPQQTLAGGFVYGDVVEVRGTMLQKAMVIQNSPASKDRVDEDDDDEPCSIFENLHNDDTEPGRLLVLTADRVSLEVAVHQLTLVKEMTRWRSQQEMGQAPPPFLHEVSEGQSD